MRGPARRLVVAAVAFACAQGAAAEASTIVAVCGQELCASDGRGKHRIRLTHDGARQRGGYSRPSLSRDGRRLAFKLGDPGRAFTASLGRRRGHLRLGRRVRIGPAPDGPRDATQYDVELSPDGRRVAWVEHRINVVFGTIDYRRYVADFRGGGIRQVASNGGRPFVGWFDAATIVREGAPSGSADVPVDQALCLPDPASETNGVCGRLIAVDTNRHLRHPDVAPGGRLVVATAYAPPSGIDSAVERPGAIALFDASTGALVRNLTSAPFDRSPTFSPDGRLVAFERRGAVFVVPTRGGAPRRVLRGARQPAWSR